MKRALVCALLMALALPLAASPYSFNYSVEGAAVMGIDRVFDDGTNTVVAFYGPLGGERPTVVTSTGQVLPYRVVHRYLVLPGIQRHAVIYARGVVAQLVHGRPPSIQLPAPAYAAPASAAPAMPIAALAVAAPSVTALAPAAETVIQTPAGHTIRPLVAALPAPAAIPTQPTVAASASIPAAPAAGAVTTPAVSVATAGFIVTDGPAPPPPPQWMASPGASLRITTEQWAERAGWTVYWQLKNGADYETLSVSASGDFLSALRDLYAPYLQSEGGKPVRVAAYSRQKILVISE
jgi:hypothetical protein